MKKYISLVLFMILFFPLVVEAKEYCKVVEGNGKDIGSEIVCNNEHFYVISSNDTETRMLAKYNLNVGETIKKEKIEKEEEDTRTDEQYCQDLASQEGGSVRSDEFYNAPGYCFIAVPLNSTLFSVDVYTGPNHSNYNSNQACSDKLQTYLNDNDYYYFYERMSYNQNAALTTCYFRKINKKLYQSENSISAHWDENDNFIYPQVGDTYVVGSGYSAGTTWNSNTDTTASDLYLDENSSEKYDGYFYDLKVRNEGQFYYYLEAYSNSLSDYDIESIDLITLDDINQIITKNNKSLPYQELYNASINTQPPRYEFGFLQDYLNESQKFIFNTTYWVRTGYNKIFQDDLAVRDVVFIDERGGICGSAVSRENVNTYGGSCNYKIERQLKSSVGTGIRPVLTISNDSLHYQIKTRTDGNGTIEVMESALGGDQIQFRVTSRSGLKLAGLRITTDSGETVEITEGEIINNDDGSITIDNNKFTMPFENVTIEAEWASSIINPKTGVVSSVLIISVLLIISFGIHTILKQRREYTLE